MVSGSERMRARAGASSGTNSRRITRSVSRIGIEVSVALRYRRRPGGSETAGCRRYFRYNLSAMAGKDLTKNIEELREKLRFHEYRYYVLDDAEIYHPEIN